MTATDQHDSTELASARRVLGTEELRQPKLGRDAFRQIPRHRITVVLDRVHQNYNVGAIFRLCDAMLIERLVICGHEVELYKHKLVQAAKGSQNWVPWSQAETAADVVAGLKADGYQIAIAELATDSVPPDHYSPRFPVCLVLGGEFSGISPAVAAMADVAVEIPMLGMANSINVSTAAAIILYRLSRACVDATAPDAPTGRHVCHEGALTGGDCHD